MGGGTVTDHEKEAREDLLRKEDALAAAEAAVETAVREWSRLYDAARSAQDYREPDAPGKWALVREAWEAMKPLKAERSQAEEAVRKAVHLVGRYDREHHKTELLSRQERARNEID